MVTESILQVVTLAVFWALRRCATLSATYRFALLQKHIQVSYNQYNKHNYSHFFNNYLSIKSLRIKLVLI